MQKIVAVIGGHSCNKQVERLAYNLGLELAEVVDYLVCGGLSGVMKAVCKGFKAGSINAAIKKVKRILYKED